MASIAPNQLDYILALEKTGSFSKAADMCYVTQSTLSTMIKKIENQMNIKLFDRKSKPILPTAEGKLLIRQIRILQREHEILDEMIQEITKEFHGTLKIGIIPTLAPFLIPLFLDNMINEYPNVDFSIDEITTNEIIDRIKKREIDIGILSLPIGDKELIEHNLFYEDFLVYDANQLGEKTKKKSYKIKDIDVNRLWLLEESHCLSNQIENICELRSKRKINNNLSYNSGSILSLLELVNMNKGLTLLPRLATLNEHIIKPNLIFTLTSPQPVRLIGMIMHPNFSKNKMKMVLEKHIQKSVKPFLKNFRNTNIIDPNRITK